MAWETGQCCSTISTVATELQSSHRMVDQTIDDLIRTGLIVKEQCWRKNSGRSSQLFFTKGE